MGRPTAATIKDVLPAGVTYVAGSATTSENGEFVFAGYDSGDPNPDVDRRAGDRE